jgi:hypothetical protein
MGISNEKAPVGAPGESVTLPEWLWMAALLVVYRVIVVALYGGLVGLLVFFMGAWGLLSLIVLLPMSVGTWMQFELPRRPPWPWQTP